MEHTLSQGSLDAAPCGVFKAHAGIAQQKNALGIRLAAPASARKWAGQCHVSAVGVRAYLDVVV